jgi:3-isopropylmalate/(R)-2-methylmalate dehydratase small subunit
MEAFQHLDAVAAPMPVPNVDTDQVIPARFLRKPRKDGYGQYLFHDLRFDDGGREKPEFVLNRPPYRAARILVADKNFGCGSSREHAVYALWDYGFRAVIAPSFGDIFYENSFKNGFLPIVLPVEATTALCRALEEKPGVRMIVDLAYQTVIAPDHAHHPFEIDEFRKWSLLHGKDELDFTLDRRTEIEAFEHQQAQAAPWL